MAAVDVKELTRSPSLRRDELLAWTVIVLQWTDTRRETDEERHLCGEDEFVSFKEAARCVDEHRVRDTVDQIDHSLFHLLGRLGTVNGVLEYHAECLHTQSPITLR